jgi:hypothetical protein
VESGVGYAGRTGGSPRSGLLDGSGAESGGPVVSKTDWTEIAFEKLLRRAAMYSWCTYREAWATSSRGKEAIRARCLVTILLRRAGVSLAQIGRLFETHHTSPRNWEETGTELLQTDRSFDAHLRALTAEFPWADSLGWGEKDVSLYFGEIPLYLEER